MNEATKELDPDSLALSFDSVLGVYTSMFADKYDAASLFVMGFALEEHEESTIDIADGWNMMKLLWADKPHPNKERERGAECWERAHVSLGRKDHPMDWVIKVR